MPKLPAWNAKKVIAILAKKGFILDRVKGSHQIYRIKFLILVAEKILKELVD